MKLYYIDESMFQTSPFSIQIQQRFEKLLSKQQHSLVFVSVTGKHNKNLEHFILSQQNTVLLSPAVFDYESIKGNLHTTFLAIEQYPVMESYSGSCVEYDTDTNVVRRIYLDLFIAYDKVDLDHFVEELEEMLQDKIQLIKKKMIMS